jgi:MerR family Zn(II)-responsive transcriptional regulator of zntA
MIAHEIADLAGVKTNVVRYYSRIGLLRPTRNPENGYREYTPRDVKRVRFIRKAKWLGFTLKDVKTILDEADAGISPCHKVRSIISDRVVENQQRLEHLQQIQERMESAMASWAELSDSAPGNENICGLIDKVDCNEEELDLCVGHKF